MRISKFLSGAIAAVTLVGFVGTTSIAEASPWSWAKRAEHGFVDRAEHAAVGVASLVGGTTALIAGPLAALNLGIAGAFLGDTGLALAAMALPVGLTIAGAAAMLFGVYELDKAAKGVNLHVARNIGDLATDGYNGVRNAFTKVKIVDIMGDPIPLPAGSSPSTQNAGMHH